MCLSQKTIAALNFGSSFVCVFGGFHLVGSVGFEGSRYLAPKSFFGLPKARVWAQAFVRLRLPLWGAAWMATGVLGVGS